MEKQPSFDSDPTGYLQFLIHAHPPSLLLLERLAGSIATFQKDNTDANIASLYLQACAKHLIVQNVAATGKTTQNRTNNHNELVADSMLNEIYTAIGYAAKTCTPRSLIASSGILSIMASLLPPQQKVLSTLHVEFLQVCIFAEHYHLAAKTVESTWPRPDKTASLELVLRYYYLRGVVHVQCGEWSWAARCFWTCLAVPEVVRPISLEAWKKLLLVHCLQYTHCFNDTTCFWALPKCINPAFSRLLQHPRRSNTTDVDEDIPEMAMHLVEMNEESTANTASTGPASTLAPYAEFVHTFVQVEPQAMSEIIQNHLAIFTQDDNIALIYQCQEELQCRQVYQWCRVYSAVSLDELSQWLTLTPDRVETLLWRMSTTMAWPVRVEPNGTSKVVHFPPLPVSCNESLDRTELMQLSRMVQSLDAAIASSSKYQSYRQKETDKTSSAPRGVEDV